MIRPLSELQVGSETGLRTKRRQYSIVRRMSRWFNHARHTPLHIASHSHFSQAVQLLYLSVDTINLMQLSAQILEMQISLCQLLNAPFAPTTPANSTVRCDRLI
jgi:hypothetical protein